MVFHDADLLRLTGVQGCVRDLTAAELGDLRVLGTGEWIPTLDEVLALVAGRAPLVLELKSLRGRDAGSPSRWSSCSRLRWTGGPDVVRAAAPDGREGGRPESPARADGDGNWRTARRHFRTAFNLNVDFISYAIDDLPTPMPILARRLMHIPLICWTVRTKAQLRKAKRWTDQITFEGLAV